MFGRHARTAVAVAANHDCAQYNVDAIGHVEAVRRGWEAFNHRDFAGAVQYLHPDGEAILPPGRRDPGGGGDADRLHGRDEVRRFLEKVSNAWQRVTVELREVIVVPNDCWQSRAGRYKGARSKSPPRPSLCTRSAKGS
jgi:hypothetical protein